MKFGIKFDTTSEERRDTFYAALIAALNVAIGPGDKAVITFEHERPTFRGKRKVVTTVEWEDGQDPPTFYDIGIYATQYDLFAQPSSGRSTATVGEDTTTTVDQATGELGDDGETTDQPDGDGTGVGDITQTWTEPTDDEQPKEAHEQGLDIFRRYLAKLDAQLSGQAAPEQEQPEAQQVDDQPEATDQDGDERSHQDDDDADDTAQAEQE